LGQSYRTKEIGLEGFTEILQRKGALLISPWVGAALRWTFQADTRVVDQDIEAVPTAVDKFVNFLVGAVSVTSR
jgi:hypothetical protein